MEKRYHAKDSFKYAKFAKHGNRFHMEIFC